MQTKSDRKLNRNKDKSVHKKRDEMYFLLISSGYEHRKFSTNYFSTNLEREIRLEYGQKEINRLKNTQTRFTLLNKLRIQDTILFKRMQKNQITLDYRSRQNMGKSVQKLLLLFIIYPG